MSASWEADARRNTEAGVRLLCEMVAQRLAPVLGYNVCAIGPESLPLLEWYVEHRKIQLRAMDPRGNGPAERIVVANDIARCEKWIDYLQQRKASAAATEKANAAEWLQQDER